MLRITLKISVDANSYETEKISQSYYFLKNTAFFEIFNIIAKRLLLHFFELNKMGTQRTFK